MHQDYFISFNNFYFYIFYKKSFLGALRFVLGSEPNIKAKYVYASLGTQLFMETNIPL